MADPITAGKLEVRNAGENTVMRIDPDVPSANLEILHFDKVVASFGDETSAQALRVSVGGHSVHYLHHTGLVSFGSQKSNGNVNLNGSDGKRKIRLDADAATCQIGGDGRGGQLTLFPFMAKNTDSTQKASIHLLADQARIRAGGGGLNGDLVLFDHRAKNPDSDIGGEGVISLSAGDAAIRVGGYGLDGGLFVLDDKGKTVVELSGKSGDITLHNADCAEEFDVDDPALEPGSVLVLDDEPGRLRLSDAPYDTRVAGILSGAGDYRPAIVLDRRPGREGRRPVALAGKVWCKAEAGSAPIRVGSLLTTSSLPGHAMAATDRERAFGAVLGKALAPLAAGVGVVPVLVALQ